LPAGSRGDRQPEDRHTEADPIESRHVVLLVVAALRGDLVVGQSYPLGPQLSIQMCKISKVFP